MGHRVGARREEGIKRSTETGFRMANGLHLVSIRSREKCQIVGAHVINEAAGICAEVTGGQQESRGWREFRLKAGALHILAYRYYTQ